MKTVIVSTHRTHPNIERVKLAIRDAKAEGAVISVAEDALVPEDVPAEITVLRHKNSPTMGSARIVHYMNEVMAPLAKAAILKHPLVDAFIYMHDDTEPNAKQFSELLSYLNRYHFASGAPYTTPAPVTGEPLIRAHTDRLVAWRASSFAKYLTRDYPSDAKPGFDSMNYVMDQMDAVGDAYIWTDIVPTQVQL